MTIQDSISSLSENQDVKVCTKCGVEKTMSHFYKCNDTKDGFQFWCIECKKIANDNPERRRHLKEYRDKKINKKKAIAYNNTYREENKKALAVKAKTYREVNKEKIKKRRRITYIKNRDKVLKATKVYVENNKTVVKERKSAWYQSQADRISAEAKEKRNSACLFDNIFVDRLSIYDEVSEGANGVLEVRCAYCGRKVVPTVSQVKKRLEACEMDYGRGESRFYCKGSKCRSACPIFNQNLYPKGFKAASSREVDPLIRQMAFKRDDYTCQHCGDTIQNAQLHCHHILGVAHSPMEQNDMSNTTTLCKKCHIELHKLPGCTYQDYKCA